MLSPYFYLLSQKIMIVKIFFMTDHLYSSINLSNHVNLYIISFPLFFILISFMLSKNIVSTNQYEYQSQVCTNRNKYMVVCLNGRHPLCDLGDVQCGNQCNVFQRWVKEIPTHYKKINKYKQKYRENISVDKFPRNFTNENIPSIYTEGITVGKKN